jgi:hypothetical protein
LKTSRQGKFLIFLQNAPFTSPKKSQVLSQVYNWVSVTFESDQLTLCDALK